MLSDEKNIAQFTSIHKKILFFSDDSGNNSTSYSSTAHQPHAAKSVAVMFVPSPIILIGPKGPKDVIMPPETSRAQAILFIVGTIRKISARVSRIIKSNRVRATNEKTQILMNAFVNLVFEFSVKRNWGNGTSIFFKFYTRR